MKAACCSELHNHFLNCCQVLSGAPSVDRTRRPISSSQIRTVCFHPRRSNVVGLCSTCRLLILARLIRTSRVKRLDQLLQWSDTAVLCLLLKCWQLDVASRTLDLPGLCHPPSLVAACLLTRLALRLARLLPCARRGSLQVGTWAGCHRRLVRGPSPPLPCTAHKPHAPLTCYWIVLAPHLRLRPHLRGRPTLVWAPHAPLVSLMA